MVKLFQRNQSVISRHVNNVFREGELQRKSNMQKMHIANSDKPVAFYNLDVIISVGYRVKSEHGTRFRIWATRILKDHLVKGYTLNQRRLTDRNRDQRGTAGVIFDEFVRIIGSSRELLVGLKMLNLGSSNLIGSKSS